MSDYYYPEDYYSYDYGYQNTRLPNSNSGGYYHPRKYAPYPEKHYDQTHPYYHQQDRYGGQYTPETSSYRHAYSSMGDMSHTMYSESDYSESQYSGYGRPHDSHYRSASKYSSMNLNADKHMNYQSQYGHGAYKQGPDYHTSSHEYYYEDAYASDPYMKQHEYYHYGHQSYVPTSTMGQTRQPTSDLGKCQYGDMI